MVRPTVTGTGIARFRDHDDFRGLSVSLFDNDDETDIFVSLDLADHENNAGVTLNFHNKDMLESFLFSIVERLPELDFDRVRRHLERGGE